MLKKQSKFILAFMLAGLLFYATGCNDSKSNADAPAVDSAANAPKMEAAPPTPVTDTAGMHKMDSSANKMDSANTKPIKTYP